MKESKAKLMELAAALEADFSANDDKQLKQVSINTADGVYAFLFENEGFPLPNSRYEIDIDLMPSDKKQVVMLAQDVDGFSFQIKSNGVHFQDQPIDCSVNTVTASVKITYFDGLND